MEEHAPGLRHHESRLLWLATSASRLGESLARDVIKKVRGAGEGAF
jgi:hypothetical protein